LALIRHACGYGGAEDIPMRLFFSYAVLVVLIFYVFVVVGCLADLSQTGRYVTDSMSGGRPMYNQRNDYAQLAAAILSMPWSILSIEHHKHSGGSPPWLVFALGGLINACLIYLFFRFLRQKSK